MVPPKCVLQKSKKTKKMGDAIAAEPVQGGHAHGKKEKRKKRQGKKTKKPEGAVIFCYKNCVFHIVAARSARPAIAAI